MTKMIGNSLIICEESEGKCEYCGKTAELRPYGKGGAKICFECGMKPENRKTTDMMAIAAIKRTNIHDVSQPILDGEELVKEIQKTLDEAGIDALVKIISNMEDLNDV
jgi:hypothetical protein